MSLLNNIRRAIIVVLVCGSLPAVASAKPSFLGGAKHSFGSGMAQKFVQHAKGSGSATRFNPATKLSQFKNGNTGIAGGLTNKSSKITDKFQSNQSQIIKAKHFDPTKQTLAQKAGDNAKTGDRFKPVKKLGVKHTADDGKTGTGTGTGTGKGTGTGAGTGTDTTVGGGIGFVDVASAVGTVLSSLPALNGGGFGGGSGGGYDGGYDDGSAMAPAYDAAPAVAYQPAPVQTYQPAPTQSYEPAPVPSVQTVQPVTEEATSTDLVLEDAKLVNPATQFAGPSCAVSFRNQGLAATGKFVVAAVTSTDGQYREDAPKSVVEVPGLAAGESKDLVIRLPRGESKYMILMIDANDAVRESDKTNNVAIMEMAAQ